MHIMEHRVSQSEAKSSCYYYIILLFYILYVEHDFLQLPNIYVYIWLLSERKQTKLFVNAEE